MIQPICFWSICSCSGYIIGRIGKAAALALGGSLIILQVFSFLYLAVIAIIMRHTYVVDLLSFAYAVLARHIFILSGIWWPWKPGVRHSTNTLIVTVLGEECCIDFKEHFLLYVHYLVNITNTTPTKEEMFLDCPFYLCHWTWFLKKLWVDFDERFEETHFG